MFQEQVTTKDGHVKTVVASSQEELDEAVKAVKGDAAPVSPDLTVPGDNAIVSPDNLAVEPPYVQPKDPEVEEPTESKEDKKSINFKVK